MSQIKIARDYVCSRVLLPALAHKDLPKKIHDQIIHAGIWLDQFQRVGDLLAYLKRFNANDNAPTYTALKALDLTTFEDIVVDFEKRFSLWSQDCTRESDFVIGKSYNSYQILIFTRNYDTRAGGMFVLESGGEPSAVIIKATLSGGHYANEWVSEANRLKYYLKSRGADFGEHFSSNAAILNNHSIPILTFVRSTNNGPFTYQGVFKYRAINRETDGSKWFDLERVTEQSAEFLSEADFISGKLEQEIKSSLELSREQRLERLKKAPVKPVKTQVISTAFNRNPDVIAEVLFQANGICQSCKQPAPFLKRKDLTPFLEVHHRKPLSEGGDDTVENAIALCPNCHRKFHFGPL